jgi:hypothetical protein
LGSGIGGTLHDRPGSVHSPDPLVAAAIKWISSGKECWGSLIVAIRGGSTATKTSTRRSESHIPNGDPGEYPPEPPVRSTGPVISASHGQVLITGIGFLPNYPVTVRVTCSGDEIVDYITYISDGLLTQRCRRPQLTKPGTSPSPTTAPAPQVTAACCGVTPSSLPLPAREIRDGRRARPQIVCDPDWEPFTGRSAQRTGFLPIQTALACNGIGVPSRLPVAVERVSFVGGGCLPETDARPPTT